MPFRDLAFSVACAATGLLVACSGASTTGGSSTGGSSGKRSGAAGSSTESGAAGRVSVGGGSSGADGSEASAGDGGAGGDSASGGCSFVSKTVTGLTAIHVAECSALDYPDNPPAGGDHYPVWAAFQSFSFAVPRGYWVHDLEHGAIVFSYHCDAGCPDEVAAVQALIDALPSDPLCPGDPARRVILTPDPLLDVRWGVSAWGSTLRADCVDSQRFTQFYLDHFGQGLENFCTQGTDFGGVPPCQ